MLHQFPPDIEALIQAQMASGHFHSLEELLRVALEQLAAQHEDVRAIEESIDLLDAGDAGVPLDAAFDGLRTKHNVAAVA
jgi:Arc/MetJ-type ribon-helix-helix transcriptional regulator